MVKFLESIDGPSDLKKLSPSQLVRLAEEIRAMILDVVSKNGGHLATNLGVVELTIALHYVFDAPRDKIIWDVGHQSYAHKILTGRKKRFSSLRKQGGILGFPCREESDYDVYNTGHASTALSAALGLAVARDRKNESHRIVAVVGDGSLTGGVAWEALNQIGHLREKIVILLNYNEMSISPNVGAMSKYLTYLVSGERYLKIKDQAKSLLKTIPGLGPAALRAGRAVEDLVKKTFFPGLVFEELGIKYVGPVRGHHLPSLIRAFEEAKDYDGPLLIHCVTRKGRGYLPAQSNPEKYHGACPFDISTGRPRNTSPSATYSSVFGSTMMKLAERDKRLLAITAAMPEGTGLQPFAQKYSDRFFDVGIAEQHAVNFAAGLALGGFRPVVAVYSTFLQRAYDQVCQDVCLMDLPVIFGLDRAGLVSDDGPTHQGVNDIVYLRHLPNIIVMAPKDENELQHMLYSALDYGHPVSVRFPKAKVVGVRLDNKFKPIPLGKAEVLKKGKDLFLALGSMVEPALNIARRLERRGISLAVVNARFVKPLDEALILSYAGRGRTILTAEEGVTAGGFGSAVRELLDRERKFEVKFKALGLPVEIYPLGTRDQVKALYRLDEQGLEGQIMEFYKKTR
jgi:1-deoxy-D-xylulose-5-phosphate synthase